MVVPRKASAISFILTKTIEEISSAENCLSSPLYETTIIGLSPAPGTTLKGQCFMSLCTDGSENLLPINRFASVKYHIIKNRLEIQIFKTN
ncbi:hypothetical protein Hanom_Chr06g00496121 [Helianthus anomalus]